METRGDERTVHVAHVYLRWMKIVGLNINDY